MSMFDNYPQPADYVPNNRPCCCKHKGLDIMTGETAVHSFEVPFNIEESCYFIEVIYLSGIHIVLIKDKDELEIVTTECNTSLVVCKLSEKETCLFDNTLLDTKVQLKFYMNNNTISYSEIYNVKIKESLDANRIKPIPPKPGVLGGLGYTED